MNSPVVAAVANNMKTSDVILLIFCAVFAAGALLISIFQFLEKGFLFNNAYIFASNKERLTMDKRPYYRQSAIAFLIMSLIFFTLLPYLLFNKAIFLIIVICLTAALLIYVMASSILILNKKK